MKRLIGLPLFAPGPPSRGGGRTVMMVVLARDRARASGGVSLRALHCAGFDLFRMHDCRFLVVLLHSPLLPASGPSRVSTQSLPSTARTVNTRFPNDPVQHLHPAKGPGPKTRHRRGPLSNNANYANLFRRLQLLAGKRRTAAVRVVHLRARNRSRLDLFAMLDRGLFVRLLHATPLRLRSRLALDRQEVRVLLLPDLRGHLDLRIYVSRISRLNLRDPWTE